MPVTLSIKKAPDDLVRRLKARASRHHRSLQGELMAIIEKAAREEAALDLLTPQDVLRRARRAGLRSESSVELIREMRETRHGGSGR